MKRFFLLPGLVLEGVGVLIMVAGILIGNTILILAGAGIICLALLVHTYQFLQLRRMDNREITPDAGGQVHYDPLLLYSDRLVRIADDSIMFLNYSFPTMSSRKVLFNDIDHISVKKSSLGTGKWRMWGSGDFCTWFPLDSNRSSRDRIFHTTLKTRGMNIGFTVDNSSRVISILKEKGVLITETGE
jgi:hypothetical protein